MIRPFRLRGMIPAVVLTTALPFAGGPAAAAVRLSDALLDRITAGAFLPPSVMPMPRAWTMFLSLPSLQTATSPASSSAMPVSVTTQSAITPAPMLNTTISSNPFAAVLMTTQPLTGGRF